MMAGITTGLVVAVLGLGTASLVLDPVEMQTATLQPAPVVAADEPAPEAPAVSEPEAAPPVDEAMDQPADLPSDGAETAPPVADAEDVAEPSATTPSQSSDTAQDEADSTLSDGSAPVLTEDQSATADTDTDTAPGQDEGPVSAESDEGVASTITAPPSDTDMVAAEPEADMDTAGTGMAADDAGNDQPASAETPDTTADTVETIEQTPQPDEGLSDEMAMPTETAEASQVPQAASDDGMSMTDDTATADDTGAMADDATVAADDTAPMADTADAPPPPADETAATDEIAALDLPEAPADDMAPEAPSEQPAADTAATPRVIEPDAPLIDSAESDVVTNRLPRIGDAPAVAEESAFVPALKRNAIDFTVPGDQPLLSILLLDTGGDRSEMSDLGELPFPVTVAVDAAAPDAEEALQFYRDQGAEVMVIIPLPEGATPTDVDVTFEAYAPLLDPAVAVMTEESFDFQTLGNGAAQVGVNLAETGHGLVTFPAGLNTGHKAALKEGVKAGLVFRDLDGEGQEGPVIRRFLDNAAFRARNEDGVIVVARTRPETIQALLEWTLGTRAETVTLAPISAILEDK